jgi:hypothetical protein
MNRIRVKSLAVGLGAVALTGGLGWYTGGALGTSWGAESSQSQAVQSANSGLPATTHPRNAKGQSYGSSALSKTPADDPDLILVVATNGREGYAYSSELNGELPKSPADAARVSAANKGRAIPVYQSDGVTRVGEFVIGHAPKS